jgi:hypothetical protein
MKLNKPINITIKTQIQIMATELIDNVTNSAKPIAMDIMIIITDPMVEMLKK